MKKIIILTMCLCMFQGTIISKNAISLAKKGNLKELKKVISGTNADVNEKDFNSGNTPLMEAVLANKKDVVAFLLDQEGINQDAQNKNGDTALILAVKNNKLALVKILLEHTKHPASPNIKNKDRKSALYIAIEKNLPTITKVLIIAKADTNIKIQQHHPLTYAAKNGSTDIIMEFLEHSDMDPNEGVGAEKDTPLIIAAKNDFDSVAYRLLLNARTDPNKENIRGETPLMVAALNNHTDTLKIILNDSRTNPDKKNALKMTAFHLALQKGQKQSAKILLPKTSLSGDVTAIDLALEKRYINLIKDMLDKEEVDAQYLQNALTKIIGKLVESRKQGNATEAKKFESLVSKIIKHPKFDLKTVNSNGDYPLHVIIQGNLPKETQTILNHRNAIGQLDANANAKNKSEKTPLDIAVDNNYQEIVLLLLSNSRVNVSSETKNKISTMIEKQKDSIATKIRNQLSKR